MIKNIFQNQNFSCNGVDFENIIFPSAIEPNICTKVCENSGTLNAACECACLPLYSGTYCEIGIYFKLNLNLCF